MPSVIRLLPPKKTERHVQPYRALLAAVFNRRVVRVVYFLQSFVLVMAFLLSRAARVGFWSVYSGLLVAVLAAVSAARLFFSAQPPAFPSTFSEIVGKLASWRMLLSVVYYVASAGYYYWLVWSSPRYSSHRAAFRQLPLGIPNSLALHQTDQWFVLSEKEAYSSGFAVLLAVVFATHAVYSNASVIQLDPRDGGVKLGSRLRRRVPRLFQAVRLWAYVSAAWPLLYFFVIRGSQLTLARVRGTVTLSGFKPVYLLIPTLYLPTAVLWVASTEAFVAYMSFGPFYRGKPISDSAVSNPNASLYDGLTLPPDSLAALLAWNELLVIAEHVERRRKSIYDDVDNDRVLWDEIHVQFLKIVDAQSAKLEHASARQEPHQQQKNVAPGQALSHERSKVVTEKHVHHQILPKRSAHDVLSPAGFKREDHSVVARPGDATLYKPQSALEKRLATLTNTLEAKSTARAQRARAVLSRWHTHIVQRIKEYFDRFYSTKPGAAFRRTVPRRLDLLLRHRQTTAFAMRAISRLTTRSLTEDERGYVQGTIAATLASLDKLSARLEALIVHPPIDNTDVLVKHGEQKPDVFIAIDLLAEANSAFAEVAEVFGTYFDNLNVSTAVRARSDRLARGELVLSEKAWVV